MQDIDKFYVILRGDIMNREKRVSRLARNHLSVFFEPESLAVIGSFKENYFGGYVVIKSLLEAGYPGRIYPVNPHTMDVQGLKVFSSLRDIPDKIDLVFVMINARSVPQVIRECGEAGIRAVVVIADGFAERNREGARLQKDVVQLARQYGIRIMGPNTAGILNTFIGLNPAPYEAGYYRIKKGPVGIVSQTGMVNPQAVPYPDLRYGVSKICDLGNKSDLDECDILEYLAEDTQTGVISMYLESIRNGERFIRACRAAAVKKPVVVVKAGRTGAGARATASHTGSMAVDDKIFSAACRQGGVLRLDHFNEIFELPKIFALQPLPRGNRLGILTVTGGVAVMCIDKGAEYSLELTGLSADTAAMLDDIFPGAGKMPVDIGPMMAAVKDAFSLYPRILEKVLSDDLVDSLLNIIWANPSGNIIENYLRSYENLKGRNEKPVVTWIYGPDKDVTRDVSNHLEDMGFPVFAEPETCVKALGLAFQYVQNRVNLEKHRGRQGE